MTSLVFAVGIICSVLACAAFAMFGWGALVTAQSRARDAERERWRAVITREIGADMVHFSHWMSAQQDMATALRVTGQHLAYSASLSDASALRIKIETETRASDALRGWAIIGLQRAIDVNGERLRSLVSPHLDGAYQSAHEAITDAIRVFGGSAPPKVPPSEPVEQERAS